MDKRLDLSPAAAVPRPRTPADTSAPTTTVPPGGPRVRTVVGNTQQLRIFPSKARADIEGVAASLFRTGLLRSAPDLQEKIS
ncbi:hypothetical protein [Streptomyces mirabilis]